MNFPEKPINKIESPDEKTTHSLGFSENSIPLVLNKEGQKVESLQYKQLNEIAPDQAMEIYKSLQELGSGEFKDSKLRDENGELRIVWHGSPRKFEEFKTDSKGEWRWRNHGVHYSSSKEVVEEYSEKAYTALNNIRYNLAIEMAGLKYGDAVTLEHVAAADKVYNEIMQDLVEKGEESQYFKKGYKFDHEARKPSNIEDTELDAIVYGKNNFGTSWTFEIFNGEMPTRENAEFSEDNQLWLGKNIGRYMYACVLNIERPFEEETTEVDLGFENGEKAHADNKADGTILYHAEAVRAMGGDKEETKGTYSVAIFDSKQAKVIGVEKIEGKNGKKTFYPNKEFIR